MGAEMSPTGKMRARVGFTFLAVLFLTAAPVGAAETLDSWRSQGVHADGKAIDRAADHYCSASALEIICRGDFPKDAQRMVDAFESDVSTAEDRKVLVDTLLNNTSEGLTNWKAAAEQYAREYKQRGAAGAELRKQIDAANESLRSGWRHPPRNTTYCSTYVSKSGRHASTRCSSY